MREFAQHFGGAYCHHGGALWRTLKLPLFQPGELTGRYLAGRCRHHVLPLRLYLSISVIALLPMRLAGAIQFVGVEDPELVEVLVGKPLTAQISLGATSAGLRDGVFHCDGSPQWLCVQLQARIDVNSRAVMQQMRVAIDRISNDWGSVKFVLMPAYALALRVLYRLRGFRYTEQVVVALHVHAFWFFVLACMQIDLVPISVAGSVAIPAYSILAMRRVYGGPGGCSYFGPQSWRFCTYR